MGSPILIWGRTVPHVVEIPFAFYTVLRSLVTPGDLSSGYVFIPSWTSLVRIRPLLAMILDKELGTRTMACVFVVGSRCGLVEPTQGCIPTAVFSISRRHMLRWRDISSSNRLLA